MAWVLIDRQFKCPFTFLAPQVHSMASRHTSVKSFVPTLLAIVGIAGVVFWFEGKRLTMEPEDVSVSEPNSVNRNSRTPPAVTALETLAPEPNLEPVWSPIDEQSVWELPDYPTAWSPASRALVRVSDASAVSRSWRVGDKLSLAVPQLGETFRPIIDEIHEGAGSRAFLGRYVDADGRQQRVIVTVGSTSLFAYIDTADGAYELSADGEHGWLVPTASMMAGFDFSKQDYILLDDEGMEWTAPLVDSGQTTAGPGDRPQR